MMMARLSLLNSLPRLASMAPFLCLIVAQWEWPDMAPPSVLASGRAFTFQELDLLLDLPVAVVQWTAADRVVQLQGFPVMGQGAGRLPQPGRHVAEVVPDHGVV